MKDIIRMNQLAGIITEGQAKKMMQILNENESLDPLKPQSPEEKLLSSPKEVEDNKGNIVTLIGLETKTAHGDNGVYWDSEGNRYALYKGHLTKYEMNRKETIAYRKSIGKDL
jgi:hypothetical protein